MGYLIGETCKVDLGSGKSFFILCLSIFKAAQSVGVCVVSLIIFFVCSVKSVSVRYKLVVDILLLSCDGVILCLCGVILLFCRNKQRVGFFGHSGEGLLGFFKRGSVGFARVAVIGCLCIDHCFVGFLVPVVIRILRLIHGILSVLKLRQGLRKLGG